MPEIFHGQRRLAGYTPKGRKKDMTEHTQIMINLVSFFLRMPLEASDLGESYTLSSGWLRYGGVPMVSVRACII